MKKGYSAKLILRTILCSFLIAQFYLIFLTLRHDGIPLTNNIKKYFIENLTSKNYQITFSDLKFYFPFNFKVTNINLSYQNLLKFKSDKLNVYVEPLNNGSFKLNQWAVQSDKGIIDSSLYPDEFKEVSFKCLISNKGFKLNNFSGKSNDKSFNIFWNSNKDKIIDENPNKLNIESPIDKNINTLAELSTILYRSKNSYINLIVTQKTNKLNDIELNIFSDELRYKNHNFEQLQLYADINQREIITQIQSNIYKDSNIGVKIKAPNITLKCYTDFPLNLAKNIEANFSGKQLFFNNFRFKNIFGYLKNDNLNSFYISSFLDYKNNPILLNTQWGLNKENNLIYLDLYLRDKSMIDIFTNEIPIVLSAHPTNSKIEIQTGSDFKWKKIKGSTNSKEIFLNDSLFNFIENKFSIDNSGEIKVRTNFSLNEKLNSLNSKINFRSNAYAFILKGQSFINQYSSIAPKWFSNIFQKFHFNELTHMDYDLSLLGNFKNPIPTILFGSINTKNIQYRNVKFLDSAITIESKNYSTKLSIKNARTNSGKVDGSIKLIFKPDGIKGAKTIQTQIYADLSLNHYKLLFEDFTSGFLNEFSSDNKHLLFFESVFFNKKYKSSRNQNYYNCKISSNNDFKFFGKPFNGINLNLYGRNNNHYIRDLQTNFLKGLLSINGDITNDKISTPYLRLMLNLKEAITNENLSSSFNLKSDLKVDLKLSSKGPLKNFYSHKGYGNLVIKGDDLAKINLLGPLSKTLQDLEVPIGTLALDTLDSDFLINGEKINFSTLKLTGNDTSILGKGSYKIPDQSIDFKVKVNLLNNSQLSFLSDFIKPLSEILSFSVTGTINDQKWRSIFDPRNLFQ